MKYNRKAWKRSFLSLLLVFSMLTVFCFSSVIAFAEEENKSEPASAEELSAVQESMSAQSAADLLNQDPELLKTEIKGDPPEEKTPSEIPSGLKAGWSLINGNWYYADKNGKALTGWQKVNGKWYYMDPETAIMMTGFITDDQESFYLDASGAMAGGGWHLIGGIWYYMKSSGALTKGWVKVRKIWYYMNPETGAMATGWVEDSGKRYYLSASGAMQTGWVKTGGKWYYLSAYGAMLTGWQRLNGKWYYLNPESGAMAVGWVFVDGKWYYLSGSGAMATGWVRTGGKWFYLSASGAMQTGWQKVGGTWYYLDPENGDMQTGWVLADDVWFYMNKDGSLFTGWLNYYGNWYYLTYNGMVYTGLAPWGTDYYYVKNGLYDNTYSGKAKIAGYKREFDVVNGFLSGGIVPPSEAVAAKAERVLNSLSHRNLWEAYRWCIMHWESGAGINDDMGIAYFANYGFDKGTGNCYVMAATFTALARQLGYEAFQMTGAVPSMDGGVTPHSWVEIGGKVYDPDFEAEGGGGGFGFSYGTPGTWYYVNYHKMHN